MTGQVETTTDIGSDEEALCRRWLRELSLASGHEKKWRERANKIIDRYRDEDRDEDTNNARFNILYANTEVLKGVMYQRKPVPDVRRRFLDKDPVGREAAQVLQRSLSYSIDAYDFDEAMRQVVEDVLLPGRGLARVKYKSEMGQVQGPDGQMVEQVVYEAVECDYVEWEMVRISPAKRWRKVRWIAFGELLTRDELVKQFGDKGKFCSLDWAPKGKEEEKEELFKRALVWTIWDKSSRKVYVVSKGYTQAPLAVMDDPLQLEQFFPCPRPVVSINTTNNMTPVPEFVQYQDQAIELDNITARIDKLVDALRRRGVYDGKYKELEKLANAGDNEFIPVENYVALMEAGGIDKIMWQEPVETIAKVLIHLYDQRDRVKQVIYEVTGIADVVRGATNANETLGAQEMKARYANSRIAPRQQAVANFARDILRLKAEIMAERFSIQTFAQMTGLQLPTQQQKQAAMLQMQAAQQMGQQVPPDPMLKKPTWEEVLQVLRSDKLRGFKVDIETDSTIQPDASEEQKNRIEFVTAITSFLEKAAPAVQAGAIPVEFAKELMSFGARGFRVSPQLEDALDSLGEQGQGNQAKEQQEQMQQQHQQTLMAAETRKADAEAREAEAKAAEAEAKALIAQAQAAAAQSGAMQPTMM